ncbi:MAG: VOC family protein [Kofleriaceae bacterium]|nr:VOC family protein [Kofleriaceae bacterium]
MANKAVKAKAAKTKVKAVAKQATPKVKAVAKKAKGPELKRVAFTMFEVEDPKRARNFYEDVLGFTRGLAAPNGQWTEYDLPGGGCLALFLPPKPEYKRGTGGASIAFEVSDLDYTRGRLQAAGVRFMGDIIHGPHCRMQNILDSEGNSIILHQLNR